MSEADTPAIVIDKVEALRGLRLAVEARGADFVYRKHGEPQGTCSYVWEGKPDCMVAEALHQLGVPDETLGWVQNNVAEVNEVRDEYEGDGYIIQDAPGVDIKPEAVAVFTAGQQAQDLGQPWGTALSCAEAAVLDG